MISSPFLRTATLAAGLAGLLLSGACSYEVANPCNVDTAAVTYSNDIQGIIQANCLKCHNAKDNSLLAGGHNWENFDELQAYAKSGSLAAVVEQKDPNYAAIYMPRSANKLSACDIERIKAWAAAGAPKN